MGRLKSIAYKLYLSLQALLLVVGLGVAAVCSVIYAHDSYLISRSEQCFSEKIAFPWNLEWKSRGIRADRGGGDKVSASKSVKWRGTKFSLPPKALHTAETECGLALLEYQHWDDELVVDDVWGGQRADPKGIFAGLIVAAFSVPLLLARRWFIWLVKEGS